MERKNLSRVLFLPSDARQVVWGLASLALLGLVDIHPARCQQPAMPANTLNVGSSPGRTLNVETAEQWAKLVLKSIDREFPNKPSVVYASAEQIVAPKAMFPAFYGCFDWHSSVHGHWVLVHLLRRFPDMPSADLVREALTQHLTKANLLQETESFAREEQKSFERMYGWA